MTYTKNQLDSNTFTSDKFFYPKQIRNQISPDKSIGLCHGVFDVLHVGHIQHLRQAKENCEVLVVSLTSDDYVNKGPDRPFFSIEHRINVISSLEFVDFVTVSEHPSSEYVIESVKPTYYIKGIEYKDKEDITNKIDLERDTVENNGGEMLFISNENVFSSSKLLNQSLMSDEFLEFTNTLKETYSIEDILGFIDSLSDKSVNLVGELIIDEYIYGDCLGKSSKYPAIVFNKEENKRFLGGVGAVANQLSALVKDVELFTYLGEFDLEENLKFAKENLSDNVSLTFVVKEDSPTIKKTRFIDSYWKSRLFETYEMNDRPLEEDEKWIKDDLISKLQNSFAIDYGHGFLEGNENVFSVNVQSNSGNRGYNFISKYKNSKLYIIDEGELRLEMRDKHSEPMLLAKNLQEAIGGVVVVTRGSHGCIVVSDYWNGIVPAISGNIKDTVGAGDAFFGIFSTLFSEGVPLKVSAFLANVAGYMEANVIGHKHNYNKLDFKQTTTALLK
jgi:rfaE bifunctional protein nucleotidyltransferase chain/domain